MTGHMRQARNTRRGNLSWRLSYWPLFTDFVEGKRGCRLMLIRGGSFLLAGVLRAYIVFCSGVDTRSLWEVGVLPAWSLERI